MEVVGGDIAWTERAQHKRIQSMVFPQSEHKKLSMVPCQPGIDFNFNSFSYFFLLKKVLMPNQYDINQGVSCFKFFGYFRV